MCFQVPDLDHEVVNPQISPFDNQACIDDGIVCRPRRVCTDASSAVQRFGVPQVWLKHRGLHATTPNMFELDHATIFNGSVLPMAPGHHLVPQVQVCGANALQNTSKHDPHWQLPSTPRTPRGSSMRGCEFRSHPSPLVKSKLTSWYPHCTCAL